MKFKNKNIIQYSMILIYFVIFRYIIEGRNDSNSFYHLIDFTSNHQGYLSYFSLSTFHSLVFLFILNSDTLHYSNSILMRISRKNLFYKNLKKSIFTSAIFVSIYSLPHIVFMIYNFDSAKLNELNFYQIYLIQCVSIFLYYFLISQIFTYVYYKTSAPVISIIIVFFISSLLMFAFHLFKITTPIKWTLICTQYYFNGKSIEFLIKTLLPFIPLIFIFAITSKFELENKDVLPHVR